MAETQRGTEGTVHNVVTLREPILAQLTPTSGMSRDRSQQLNTFNIIALGDVEGHSPSACGVDSEGRLFWESFQNFRVADPRYLPPSIQQLQRIQQGDYQRA